MIDPASAVSVDGDVRPPFPITPVEWHSGVLVGRSPVHSFPARWDLAGGTPMSPRAALETAVDTVLRAGRPTAVQFSGGRDSSLVLAVAVDVARREGLPVPRVVSVRYPGVAEAAESDWQELVAGHLGVELEVITVAAGDDDLAGPFALGILRRTGPSLPPTSGVVTGRLAEYLPGHTVLTGEGGDNVLGQQRVTWWSAHWQARRWPQPHALRAMAFEVLPRSVRRRRVRTRLEQELELPWVRPDVRSHLFDLVAAEMTSESWDWRDATWGFLDSRIGHAVDELDRVGSLLDVHLAHPLLAPTFVAALCRDAGRWGYIGRADAMRMLAGDLLPEELISRESKAYFNRAYSGHWTREFARTWDGAGVDADLVDVETLRAAWTSEVVPPLATAPLQLALYASLHTDSAPAGADR